MQTTVDTLSTMVQVTIAFVAFSTIVTTIRLSSSSQISDYQRLLVHFFTETSMLAISIALFALVSLNFVPENPLFVARTTIVYSLVTMMSYAIWYFWRRSKIQAPISFTVVIVMLGYVGMTAGQLVTLTGLFWPPSLNIVVGTLYLNLFFSAILFVSFLGKFIDSDSAI